MIVDLLLRKGVFQCIYRERVYIYLFIYILQVFQYHATHFILNYNEQTLQTLKKMPLHLEYVFVSSTHTFATDKKPENDSHYFSEEEAYNQEPFNIQMK